MLAMRPKVAAMTVLTILSLGCRQHASTLSPSAVPTPIPSSSGSSSNYIVSGVVLAADGPVTNALVDLLGVSDYLFTGSSGRFEFGVPKGPIALRAGKWGFQTQIVDLMVDGDITRNLTLQPSDDPPMLPIGMKVTSVVKLDDTICATSDPGVEEGDAGRGLVGPCRLFKLTIPQDGTLVANVTWSDKMYMTVLTPSRGKCCNSPLTLRIGVVAGSTIELGVGIHASELLPRDATAPFDLETAFEP
jgi:hypothetical protein